MIDILRYRPLFFLVSLAVIVLGVAAFFIPPRLGWSIEFSSGATATVSFKEPTPTERVRTVTEGLGYQGTVVQSLGEREDFIRLPADPNIAQQRAALESALRTEFGQDALDGFDFAVVSPAVARETVRNGLIAVGLAVLAILAYVVWAFRGMPNPFRWGLAAIVALAHDVLIAFAVAEIAVKFIHIELSTMFMVGILTLLGYSINDTIVVFDRIRENLLRETSRDFVGTANLSILETAGRSFNTAFTTLLALLALWLLGPASIRDFLLVMIVGVTAGTYSSVFTATAMLATWQTKSLGSLPRWVPFGRRAPAAAPR